MAPGTIEYAASPASQTKVDRAIFPDGLKTSGQQEPVYSLIQPYEKFTKHITGPTVWQAEQYKSHPEKWVHVFTDEEVAEIEDAADRFIELDLPLTGIIKVRHN